MGVLYKIVGQGEEYKDKQTGQKKRRSLDLGIVMETKGGLMLKMNAIPVGWDGWAYLNEPEQQGARQQGRQQTQQRQQQEPRGQGGYGQQRRQPVPSGDGFDEMEDPPF